MNCDYVEKHIVDYIDGQLAEEKVKEIDRHIQKCDDCRKLYEETKTLMTTFEKVEEQTPSSSLRVDFYKLLEEEKQLVDNKELIAIKKRQTKTPWKLAFQIAASIIFLFTGYFLGSNHTKREANQKFFVLQQEAIKLREGVMLAMIENQSPSKRIQAVNYTESFIKPDIKILEALIERMQYDGNINVRLAAAEALSRFPESTMVKDAFIKALTTQKDPSLQITIIQFLVNIQEKRAVDPMQQLLRHSDTPDFVKEQVNQGISKIIL